MKRLRCRLPRLRARPCSPNLPYSTLDRKPTETVGARSLQAIMKDMNGRIPRNLAPLRNDSKGAEMPAPTKLQKVSFTDVKQPIAVGDLVLVSSGPAVVLELPGSYEGKYKVADSRGLVRLVGINSIEIRFGQLISKKDMPAEIFSQDDAETVSLSLYPMVAPTMRALYDRAYEMSEKIAPLLRDLLLLYQRPDRSVTFSFYDLLSIVYDHYSRPTDHLEQSPPLVFPQLPASDTVVPASFDPEFIYAVRLALMHYKLANKTQLDLRFKGNYSVTLFSYEVERNHVAMINKNTTIYREYRLPDDFIYYLRDYATNSLSSENPQAEGMALQILRYHPLTLNREENSSKTAALVADYYNQLDRDGPALGNQSYNFFTTPETTETRVEEAIAIPTNVDTLSALRKDFEVPVYCIDGPDSAEIDDGISVEVQGATARIGVHVVNPTSAFEDPRELLSRIYQQPSSVYLPDRVIPMLPKEFSDVFGFKAGESRRSLSFFTDFDLSTGQATSTHMAALNVKKIVQITYEQAENDLNSDKPLPALVAASKVANFLNKRRQDDLGGFNIVSTNTVQPKIDKKGEIILGSVSTPLATELVTELMIHANRGMADLLQKNSIPAIYRRQDLVFFNPVMRSQFESAVRSGAPLGFEWLGATSRAYFSTVPGPHESIGASVYTYFTSPLRRSLDILNHIQLQSYLLGTSPKLSSGLLQHMTPWIYSSLGLIKDCQRSVNRYWMLKRLESMDPPPRWVEGVVMRVPDEGPIQVYLPSVGLTAELTTAASQSARARRGVNSKEPIAVGQQHTFVVRELSAIADTLTVSFKYGGGSGSKNAKPWKL